MGEAGPRYYREISLKLASEDVEGAANYIIENICGGLLLEDEDEDFRTTVKFYVDEEVDIDCKLTGLKRYLSDINKNYSGITIEQIKIRELDWIEAYRQSVVPVTVGDSIVIKPPWSEEIFPGKVEILIEPKMAFGTGRHESTRGSLAELEKIDFEGKKMLDLGCGSGILSIYAALKGAAEVIGYDIDPLAIENSRENFRLNKVAHICRAEPGVLADVPLEPRFDVIVVNIIKSVIVPIIGELKSRLAEGGVLILSGLLEQDRGEVESALGDSGLTSFTTRNDSDWITYSVQV